MSAKYFVVVHQTAQPNAQVIFFRTLEENCVDGKRIHPEDLLSDPRSRPAVLPYQELLERVEAEVEGLLMKVVYAEGIAYCAVELNQLFRIRYEIIHLAIQVFGWNAEEVEVTTLDSNGKIAGVSGV